MPGTHYWGWWLNVAFKNFSMGVYITKAVMHSINRTTMPPMDSVKKSVSKVGSSQNLIPNSQ